ncbi:MAG: hypothetical protein ABI632_03690, partial [Pseudolysinimonas sp.]
MPSSSEPWFAAPIEWKGGLRTVDGEIGQTVTTSVQLLDGTRARLVDFPQGVTRQQDDGLLCLDLASAERYTGEATWANRNGYSIVLTFGESSVILSADTGRFGTQDWTS